MARDGFASVQIINSNDEFSTDFSRQHTSSRKYFSIYQALGENPSASRPVCAQNKAPIRGLCYSDVVLLIALSCLAAS